MSRMRCKAIQRFSQHIVEDDTFWQSVFIDTLDNRKRLSVCVVPAICCCKKNGCIDECTGHLLDVNSPSIMLRCDIRFFSPIVSIEIGEGPRPLLNNFDPDAPIRFNMPPKAIAIINPKLTTDPSRDVRLIARDFTLSVNPFTTHIAQFVFQLQKGSVQAHYAHWHSDLSQHNGYPRRLSTGSISYVAMADGPQYGHGSSKPPTVVTHRLV